MAEVPYKFSPLHDMGYNSLMYSQNEYKNLTKLNELIRLANFEKDDLVLDIGAGSGTISKAISPLVTKVVAYELDEGIYSRSKPALDSYENIQYLNADFILAKLPNRPFKVFSNIPFSKTSAIINKIAIERSYLDTAYLFMEREAAERFIGYPETTMISVILGYSFDCEIFDQLSSFDFQPQPDADIVVLKPDRSRESNENTEFKQFITFLFTRSGGSWLSSLRKLFTEAQMRHISATIKKNRWEKPSDVSKEFYYEIFDHFLKNGPKYRTRITD